MTIATADRARPILAEPAEPGRRTVLPDGTWRALAAGAEAAVLGWLTIVVPAVAAYVATASAPALGDATWMQAAGVGAAVWRVAHGGLVTLAGEPVTLAPTGLLLLVVLLVSWSLRRAQVRTWSGMLAVVVGYGAPALLLATLPGTAVGGWFGPALGALAVPLAGIAVAVARGSGGRWPPLGAPVQALLARVPDRVREPAAALGSAALRGATTALLALVSVGGALVVVSLAAHAPAAAGTLTALAEDGMSMVMVVLATLLYLPTFVIWAVAWAAGPGFAVGTGTIVAPGEVVLGPLPVFPVFAALPQPGTAGAGAGWVPAALLAVGLVAGWRLHRHHPQARLWASAASAVAAAGLTVLITWGLATLAAGGVGPGRMAHLGPAAGPVAWSVGLWVAAGALAVVVLARSDTLARGTGLVRSAQDALRSGVVAGRERVVKASRTTPRD